LTASLNKVHVNLAVAVQPLEKKVWQFLPTYPIGVTSLLLFALIAVM
jgi:hypothetical protein